MSGTELTDLLGADRPQITRSGRQLLSEFRRAWPLNSAALKNPAAPDGRSLRVRLRVVEQRLRDQGFVVSGFEPSRQNPDAVNDVVISAVLDRSGELKDTTSSDSAGQLQLTVPDTTSDPDGTRKALQQALAAEGITAVATMAGKLRPVLADRLPLSADELQLLELDLPLTFRRDQAARRTGRDFSPEQIADFVAASVTFAGSAEPSEWLAYGYDAQTAAMWADTDSTLRSVRQARPWIEARISPVEAGRWVHAGFSLRTREVWLQRNLTLDDALDFAAVNGRSESLDRRVARSLHLAEICDAQDRRRLRHLTGYEAQRLVRSVTDENCRVVRLRCALDWAEFEGGRHDQLSWVETRAWVDDMVGPQDVERWRPLQAAWKLSRTDVTAWVKSGLTPQQASEWGDEHELLRDARVVRGWIDDGLGIQDALPWVRAWGQIRSERLLPHYQNSRLGLEHSAAVRAWREVDERCADPDLVVRLMTSGLTPELVRACRDLLPAV